MDSSSSSLPSASFDQSQLERIHTYLSVHINHICMKTNISIPVPLIWGATNTPNIATLASEQQSSNFLDRILLKNNFADPLLVIAGNSIVIDLLLHHLMGITGEPIASRASIEKLTVVDKMIGDCAICMDDFGCEICKEMPCKHVFHGKCVEKWLNIHGTCPVCREKMPFDQNCEEVDKSREFRLIISFDENYYDIDDIDEEDEGNINFDDLLDFVELNY
ncbi:E3 ubiquitin-protein ligase MPSR1-like [Apium graveolens]|uniref:E3 ubiquitin-protein ligase MPSR1-like n=1 Tax=Apium graveolens TaxID=4045 RepID=UPI003D7BE68A